MKVLLLTPKLNGSDGISLVSRTALAALQEHGGLDVEVRTLAAESFSGEQHTAGVVCRSAGDSKARYVSWSFESLLRGRRYDLVIVMHIHLAPLAIARALAGSRLAIFLHGIEVWKPLTWLEHQAIRRASCLIANSRYTAARFKQVNPQHARREILTCSLGVPALPRPRSDGDGGYALIVGRMVRQSQYKGHELLLELWTEVQRHAPGFQLVVAGDGEDRPRLQRKAQELGLEGHVRFTGLVDDATLLQLYQDCSFFLMPSTCEGFGLVFLEAMRAGKACIAGIGASAEVVEDGVTGYVVDPAARGDLLARILELIANPERARRMGAAGYERFRRHFTAEDFGRRFLDCLAMNRAEVPQCVE
jgi:phosphatidylinositol alpha-1,6-mannosyltransferase